MKKLSTYLLTALFLTVSFHAYSNDINNISDQDIRDLTVKLETFSQDELLERRDFLITQLNEENDQTSPANSSKLKLMSLELTIIEQLLILGGLVLLDNITEDSSTPPDTVFPVITINGDNPATVELGGTYVDAGATSDGGETVSTSGSVDTNTVGTYTITYTATDAAGNTSTATRTVDVVDTTAPVITITGDNPATVELGEAYTDAGATATDLDTVSVTVSGTVDVGVVGSYTKTYTATDASGNTATATRTVNVVDTTAPVVTVTGDNPATVELGATYTDAGATATDASDPNLTDSLVTTGTVDTNTVGTYTITYTSTDASGNAGTATRTVNVVDTTAPVVTVTGDNPVTVPEASVAVAPASVYAVPSSAVAGLSPVTVTTGAVVSTTLTVLVAVAVLLSKSVAV